MTPEQRHTIATLARRQHGVLSLPQCLDAGITPSSIDRATRRKELQRVRRAVYRFAGVAADWRGELLADVLAVPGGAWASHSAALRLHGVEAEQVPFRREILTTCAGQLAVSGATVVHRTRTLPDEDVSARQLIPVTSLARTMVDVGTGLDRWAMLEVLDQVVCEHPTDRSRIHEAAARLRMGRRNAAALAAATSPDAEAAFRSWLERRAQPLIERAGIQDAQWNVRVPGLPQLGLVDTWSQTHALVIEWRGLAFHRRPQQLQRDSDKQNAAAIGGVTALSFTWTDVVRRPPHVVAVTSRAAWQNAA